VREVAPVPPLETLTGAARSTLRVPAPPVTEIVDPVDVRDAAEGAIPVDPIRSCPFVKTVEETAEDPFATRMPFAIGLDTPVPPLVAERGVVEFALAALF